MIKAAEIEEMYVQISIVEKKFILLKFFSTTNWYRKIE